MLKEVEESISGSTAWRDIPSTLKKEKAGSKYP
jgi:hypothetical protein